MRCLLLKKFIRLKIVKCYLILKLKTSDNDIRALLVCMKYERVCTRVKTIEHFLCQPKKYVSLVFFWCGSFRTRHKHLWALLLVFYSSLQGALNFLIGESNPPNSFYSYQSYRKVFPRSAVFHSFFYSSFSNFRVYNGRVSLFLELKF